MQIEVSIEVRGNDTYAPVAAKASLELKSDVIDSDSLKRIIADMAWSTIERAEKKLNNETEKQEVAYPEPPQPITDL